VSDQARMIGEALMQGPETPLTPEQEATLKRQAVSSDMPLLIELLLSGGLGGVAGRAIGRGMGHAGDYIAGQVGPGAANIAGRVGAGLGTLAGVGGFGDRARQNTIRDAEGQPGGFYGQTK